MLQKSYSKFSVTQQCILRVLGSVKKYANFSVAAVPKSSLLGPGLNWNNMQKYRSIKQNETVVLVVGISVLGFVSC